jgi:hypothetical protein
MGRTASRCVAILALIALGVVASCAVVAADASPASAVSPRPVYYVAVGDSLAIGYAAPPGTGYADDLLNAYRAEIPSLQLQTFGCASETTETMMHGGICT